MYRSIRRSGWKPASAQAVIQPAQAAGPAHPCRRSTRQNRLLRKCRQIRRRNRKNPLQKHLHLRSLTRLHPNPRLFRRKRSLSLRRCR